MLDNTKLSLTCSSIAENVFIAPDVLLSRRQDREAFPD